MQFGELISGLCTRVGVAVDNDKLKNLLSDADLAQKDIPDEIANKITSGLLDIEAAKANPTLKAHFTKQALDAVDQTILELATQHELPDDVLSVINSEKSSYKRVGLVTAEIAKLKEAKSSASKGDKAEYQKQIDELQNELKTTKQSIETEKNNLKAKYDSDLTEYMLDAMLSGKKYANVQGDDEISKRVAKTTAKNFLNESLSSDKAKIILTEAGLVLVQTDNPEMPWYDKNNTKGELNTYVDGVLARNKLTQVSNGSEKSDTPPVPGGGSTHNAEAQALIKSQLSSFKRT